MILNGTKTTGNKIEYFKDGVLTVATPSPLPPPRTIIVEQNASFDFHVDKLPSALPDQWLSRIRNKLQKLFSKRDSSFSYRFFLWIETSEPPTIEQATSSTVTVEIQIGLSNIMVRVRGPKEYIDEHRVYLRTMMEQDIPQLIIENLPLLDKVPPKKTTAIKVVATTPKFDRVFFQEEKRKTGYITNRQSEYPPMSDYLDGIVKGDQAQVQAYIDACLAVKAKYPKPV
jgi:hypothetical protein